MFSLSSNIKLIVIILTFFGPISGQKKTYRFFNPELDYGSELNFSPFTTFMNGSFDILRNGGHENNGETIGLFDLDYPQGFRNVWNNISNPFYHIRQYGVERFTRNEIIPQSLDPDNAQWVPNYIHHILGSGMLYVRMAEWYDYHQFRYPKIYSILTTVSYQFMNEALENNHSDKTNVDPIADMLIFNPLGILLFSLEGVQIFFSETVRIYDWSLQPVFNPVNFYLENAGLQFAVKYKPPFFENYSFFFHYGIDGLFGLSYSLNKEYNLSVGIGTIVNRLEENIIYNSRFITPKTDGAIGFFYDRNHSLLTSLIITGPRMYNARINIYPGLVNLAGFKPGFYMGFGQWDNLLVGITFARIPVGLLGGVN